MSGKIHRRGAGLLLTAIVPLALGGCDRLKAPGTKDQPKSPAVAVVAGPMAAGPIEIRDIAASEFDKTIKTEGKLVVVAFYSEGHDVSTVVCAMLKHVGKDFSGRATVAKINVNQAQELSKREGVREIPEVRFYRDGKVMDRLVGYPRIDEVRAQFQNWVPGGASTAGAGVPAEGKSTEPAAAGAPAQPAEPAIKPMKKGWVPEGLEKRKH